MLDTLPKALFQSIDQYGDKPALMYREGKEFVPISYRQLGERVYRCAAGLWALDVRPGDRICILSDNCPEWAIADWASICLGAISAPIYPTLTSAQAAEILADAEPKVVFARDDKQINKLHEAFKILKFGARIVSFEKNSSTDAVTLEQLSGMASDLDEATFRRRALEIAPSEIATFIYTSGTTGEPKGAMLSHSNLMSNIEASLQVLPVDHNDTLLSFLPLSHVFERMAGHFLAMRIGATVAYAESMFTLSSDMLSVQPTAMLAVPRFYGSIMDRILSSVADSPGLRKALFHRALEVGKQYSAQWRSGQRTPFLLGLQHKLLDKLVGEKIRARTGGRIRFFASGGAALPRDVAEFFHAFGLLIVEGYGLTETSPVITINTVEAPRFGTVGKPIPGVELKIAEDGEILSRGPHIMRGYYNKPQATAEAINDDGWFHTGDIGELDADGYLRITDRKKDLLVLANGKNVAPQPIENLLRSSEFIQEAALFGDGMSQPIALIIPDFERIKKHAHDHQINFANLHELVENEQIEALIKAEVDRANRQLADYQRVRRFRLLPEPFSIETGELTPTLKVKRRVVLQKYTAIINEMAS